MEFQVNTNNVILSKINQVESGEYNVTECRFIFSSEYEGLTKIAVFTGANGDAYKITILNNKCEIPSELLTESQIVQIGVYAYEVQGTEFVLRYSPMPTRFMIEKGSYVVNAVNMSRPTPTEVEQLQSQITHNSNNIEDLQQNVSENTTAIENLQNDVGDIQTEQTEQNTKIQKNTDDIVDINQSIEAINTDIGEINQDINNLETNKADKSQLSVYSLITETGSQIELNINTTNYKMKSILKDKNGNTIFTSNEIDLPLESFVVSATYDNTTKEIVLTLQNGQTIRFSVADLVSGLVSEDDLQTILANYYTKTEINNLLNNKVDKVQGKGLSEVDFTTAKDEKLEGIEAEANKTIVDNELDNTSENPVQNKVIYEALSEKQTQINNLQTDVEDLRNASLSVEGTGTDITLNNTAQARLLKNELSGRTEQEQLTGKNLFNVANVIYVNNEILNDNGEEIADNSGGYTKMYIPVKSNTDYIISGLSSLGGKRIYFFDENKDFISRTENTQGTTKTFTTPNNCKYVDIQYYISGNDFNTWQLEEGSTATSYEPYCRTEYQHQILGYECPIKNVTGNANEKIQNKNLALPTWASNFVTNVNNSIYASLSIRDEKNCLTYYASAGYNNYENCNFNNGIKFKENTQYTVSFSGIKTEGSDASLFAIEYTDGTTSNMPSYSTLNVWENKTITSQPNKTIKYIRPAYNSGRVYIDLDTFQIEEGSTETSYVPHQEQNYPFTFAEGQFLADNEKLQDNGMYKEYAQVDLSTLTWGQYATNKYNSTTLADVIKRPSSSSVKGNILAEKYQVVTQDTSFTDGVIAVGASGNIACMDTTGTPSGILQYELAEPDTIQYNSTQQAQYNAIKNARSYADVTYITSTSDELGFDMKVTAIGDANKIIDNIDTRLLALESEV